MRNVRHILIALAAIALLAVPVTAMAAFLGPDDPLGSPGNPLQAPAMHPSVVQAAKNKGHLNEARAPETMAEEAQQSEKPCTLVTADEAAAVFGESIRAPVEAPMGPTCLYRTNAREDFVSVALPTIDGEHRQQMLHGLERVDVDGLKGYCGPAEHSNLLVPLTDDRVLTVNGGGGGCEVAKAFALKALGHISRR